MAARTQEQYQVRFAWGTAGADRIAHGTHLVVWVDVLPEPSGGGADPAARARAAAALLPDGPEVVLGHLANAAAVAERVTSLQAERGDRCVVAVVAAGRTADGAATVADAAGEPSDVAETPEPAVEDLLAAGAVVDALVTVGIDHTSPEAAAACAAYTGLRRAVKHLVTAAEGATDLDRETVHAALAAGPELVVLRESGMRA
ncbi:MULTISPECIES: 2-phosphosulfolactate phosphatase [Curtobacterium]|uniref:2-phosphosulfolactate phosphatase n=1 Tax=Curtobacterium TaxID=2034 RepID=UPI001B569149|nr:2-phosphosulfolactate phosphatase [Curtobacterium sp. HSID17257]